MRKGRMIGERGEEWRVRGEMRGGGGRERLWVKEVRSGE